MTNKCFLDSVHGNIQICENVLCFIDTPEFQRLKNIKQLGNVHHVFMGAIHTRFEHSIGVSYLCGELITNLKNKQPELNITDRDILLIKIAGLCHDIGHGCFSHIFDDHFLKIHLKGTSKEKYIKHEYRSQCIIRHIIKKYKFDYTDSEIDLICEYVSPGNKFVKPKFMYQIVANTDSGLDCDKIDYLIRDPKNTGISVSFNYKTLLEHTRVINNDLCYPYDDAIDIYQMFNTRYYLHKKVYKNPIIISLNYMIANMLHDLNSRFHIVDKIDDIDTFCKCTDNIIDIDSFLHENTKLRALQNRIHTRNIYKTIFKTNNNDIIMIEQLMLHISHDNISNVIFDVSTITYNSKNNNPLSYIYFYNEKGDLNKKFKTTNYNIIMPMIFDESMLLIIMKNNDVYLQNKILQFIHEYKLNSLI